MASASQRNKLGLSKTDGRFEYDVFLSFRGKDTRNNFTGLFHYILEQQSIRAFFDEEDLDKGEKIEKIFEAISKSQIFVPIFSKGYADSKWCLMELKKMVDISGSDDRQMRRIIPIFFDVDPKEVRHQSDEFKAAFVEHQKERREEVEGWKHALRHVGEISGYHLQGDEYKSNQKQLVKDIIDAIQNVLMTKSLLSAEEYLVGHVNRVEKMMKLLNFQEKDVRIIGIHGVGGIGKTTLAKVIYDKNRQSFQASSFIENVREVSKSNGLEKLQKQLIQDISKGKPKREIYNSTQGAEIIEDMVRGKSVLLVLDDLDDLKQLEALAGNTSQFQSGSRVIITTRQLDIVERLQREYVYELEELNEEEALELFNHHAFGDDGPNEDEYCSLAKEVSIKNRLPLVLQVFGSFLKPTKMQLDWKSLLKDLGRRQQSQVHEKLRICYDRLNDQEKRIFLDIACQLVGRNYKDAIYMWEDLNLSASLALISLQRESLIKVNNGKFEMHDQIREMGRTIVLNEDLNPVKRRRLWREEDVMEALANSQGNDVIEGIVLNKDDRSRTKLSTEVFQSLSTLRILQINSAIFGDDRDFKHFPASLKWLEWKDCPIETLPLESKFKSVVVLNLSGSLITQLWSEAREESSSNSVKELFDGLKVLDLSCCHKLVANPNFAMAPNLEKLILDQCINLKEVDYSIGSLKKLRFLSMRKCESLMKLPNEIYELSSLQAFNLEGCRGLVSFPQILEDSQPVDPDGTPLTSRIVLHIGQTTSSDVANFTDDISNLKGLILRGCKKLEFLPHLHKLQSLQSVHIDDCLEVREWDNIDAVYIYGKPISSQEFCFKLLVGSISHDPLLLQQLQCHGCGDPRPNGTMFLGIHHEDTKNGCDTFESIEYAKCDDSICKDDVYGHCYTFDFEGHHKINEVPRCKTATVTLKPIDNSTLTRVDVKLQRRRKFSDEGMKPFISISRKKAFTNPSTSLQSPPSKIFEVTVFFNYCEEVDKIIEFEYSTRFDDQIDKMMRLVVDCDEPMLLFGTVEELIIFTLIYDDNVSWYELRHGTRATPRLATEKVFDKMKALNLSNCKFLVKTPNFAQIPHLEKLVLNHCECLLNIDESIGQLKNLIHLSIAGCAKLEALPCGILQLNSLQELIIKGCTKIKTLPEASMTNACLNTLKMFILDDCTSLTQLPDYVGGFKGLSHLSLRSCHSLKQLPVSIENLVDLQELILDGCTSLPGLPYYVGSFKSLRCLSMRGCPSLKVLPHFTGPMEALEELILDDCISLTKIPVYDGSFKTLRRLTLGGSSLTELPDAIGSLVVLKELVLNYFPSLAKLPDSIGNLKSLIKMQSTKCQLLSSLPDISNLVALQELNVAECSGLRIIPGLQSLRSLKVLHMNGCRRLDLDRIQPQLEEAAFHDLEEFSISAGWYSYGSKMVLFPRGGRSSSKTLYVEKINITERSNVECRTWLFPVEMEVAKDIVLRVKAVAVGKNRYAKGFGKDHDINKRLKELAASTDDPSRVGTLRIYCRDPTFKHEGADIWFRV